MHIRDPIQGAVEITADERAVIDAPHFQRLRGIRQLGFADLAFPGATHTRYAHSVGAMAVATRVFDVVFRDVALPAAERARFRQALRLAVLLHDVGHPPFSHCSEVALPPVGDLDLPAWLAPGTSRRASHEDLGLAVILRSGLTGVLDERFAPAGLGPEDVAALVSGRTPPGGSPFQAGGVDYGPLLRQMVSSELDADRMDYLFRDSFFTGVNYGKFDLDWIVQNLGLTVRDGEAYLALDARAILAFEDFLLSRWHMFMSVYFHHTPVAYEWMLQNWYAEGPETYPIPADPDALVAWDDVHLVSALRRSPSPWARRIVSREPWRPAYEQHPGDPELLAPVRDALEDAGLELAVSASRGEISKYLGERRGLWVRTGHGEVPIDAYAELFQHGGSSTLVRIYVAPEDLERARAVAARAAP